MSKKINENVNQDLIFDEKSQKMDTNNINES